jgi:hypothetical protein
LLGQTGFWLSKEEEECGDEEVERDDEEGKK